MNARILDVGAQDPELENSPIADEGDEESDAPRQPVPDVSVCYFNGTAYPRGSYVRSGTMLLRCSQGIWVEAGPADPDNP